MTADSCGTFLQMVIVSVCSMFLVIQIGLNKASKQGRDATDRAKAPPYDAGSEKRRDRHYEPVSQHEAEKDPLGSRIMLEEVA